MLLIRFRKGTPFADALIIHRRPGTDNLRFFHGYMKMRCHKIDGCQYGQIGIPLAATRSADTADLFQCFGGHLIGQSERFYCQGRGFRNDRHEYSRTDTGSASTPKTTGTTGNFLPGSAFLSGLLPGRYPRRHF